MKLTKENIKIGLSVKLSPDSMYSNQSKSIGYVLSLPNYDNWLKVKWEKALIGPKINTYELHDLILVDSIKKNMDMRLIGEYYVDNNIRYIGEKKGRYYGFADKKLNILKSGEIVVFRSSQEIINYDSDRHSLKIYKKIWI